MPNPKWELNLGAIRGSNLPKWVIAEEHRLRKALLVHCKGPYNDAGTGLGLALCVEGDDLSMQREGIKVEPFRKNYIGVRISVRKTEWNIGNSGYRIFLWQQVEKAINACVEALNRKQIKLDQNRLRLDLDCARVDFCGKDGLCVSNTGTVAKPIVIEDEREGEEVATVIQYRIEGHGRGSDHDKRVAVENVLGEFLEESGLGYCDGGDIGSGTMNVFCFVKPGRGAGQKLIELLRKNSLLEGATIAETLEGEERVIWPPDFKGAFQLI